MFNPRVRCALELAERVARRVEKRQAAGGEAGRSRASAFPRSRAPPEAEAERVCGDDAANWGDERGGGGEEGVAGAARASGNCFSASYAILRSVSASVIVVSVVPRWSEETASNGDGNDVRDVVGRTAISVRHPVPAEIGHPQLTISTGEVRAEVDILARPPPKGLTLIVAPDKA